MNPTTLLRRGDAARGLKDRARRLPMDRFLRFGLPLLLLAVFVVIALFVLNAFEATGLMEIERRAGPTLLNR